jgi:DNA-binding beta-propeller fold protein YncE
MASSPRAVAGRLPWSRWALAGAVLGLPAGRAQIAVSANDAHLVQVDGINRVVAPAPPDGLTLIDLGRYPPRIVGEVLGVPNSVIGPPVSVAITPDGSLALAVACMRVDPADPTRQVEDNRVTVVDLRAAPPRVIARLTAGAAPAAVSINRQGTLALVANRGDGSVSIFRIRGSRVEGIGRLAVGNAASALGQVAFVPDGRRALLARDGDNLVTLLAVDGERVSRAGRDLHTGFRPYGLDVAPDGRFAVVGNVGYGDGDIDTVSVIDLRRDPVRTVATIGAGRTVEGLKLSPDGRFCAVVVQNGSNQPRTSPFHSDHGSLELFRVDDLRLVRIAAAPIGHWPQGVAWSADGRTLLVGNMVERTLQVLRWDGVHLTDPGYSLAVPGGPASLRTP